MAAFGIKLQDFLEGFQFPKTAFQSQLSKDFIRAAKNNDVAKLADLLAKDRFLVHQYDLVGVDKHRRAARPCTGRQREATCSRLSTS